MDELIIKSEYEVCLTFHSRQFDKDGWLASYALTAQARNFKATIEVSNLPYGSFPSDFFEAIAAEWTGWSGKKEWSAIEGEFHLVASSDSTGHITIVAELNPNFPPYWYGSIRLIVEAGQVEKLAHDAKAFFWPNRS